MKNDDVTIIANKKSFKILVMSGNPEYSGICFREGGDIKFYKKQEEWQFNNKDSFEASLTMLTHYYDKTIFDVTFTEEEPEDSYFKADVMEAIKNEAHIHDNDMSDIYFKWKEEFGNSKLITTNNTLTEEQKQEFSNAPFVSNVVKKIEELTGKKVMKIDFTNDWEDGDRISSVEFDYQ